MNNRDKVSVCIVELMQDQHNYSKYLDWASSDRPDLRPTYDMPQYLPLRVFKMSHVIYTILNKMCDDKLCRYDHDKPGYNISGENEAVLNLIADFYKCTADYEKHTKGLGNYTPIGYLFNLRSAVVAVHGVCHGQKRAELLKQKGQALEQAIFNLLAECKDEKPRMRLS